MIIPDGLRLFLYMVMGVLPIWADFFVKSTDYSFRGLMMPIIASASAAVAIALAKTSAKMDHPKEPLQVVSPPGETLKVQALPGKPVETKETPKT